MKTAVRGVARSKQKIRNRIIKILLSQKEEDRSRKSRLIKQALFKKTVFRKAKTVMFYMSFSGEVDTSEMIQESQKLGKIIALPVCADGRMVPCLLNEHGDLLPGPYGILEPAQKKRVGLSDLGLVVVPGLAFDDTGMRLGRGKGYYDCFLKKLPSDVPSVGLAFDFQILSAVPSTPDDIPVTTVLSA